jgi:hypothetical protein
MGGYRHGRFHTLDKRRIKALTTLRGFLTVLLRWEMLREHSK